MQTITTPAIRSEPRTTSQQKPCTDIVVSCSKVEAILRENFNQVFEHIDDECKEN